MPMSQLARPDVRTCHTCNYGTPVCTHSNGHVFFNAEDTCAVENTCNMLSSKHQHYNQAANLPRCTLLLDADVAACAAATAAAIPTAAAAAAAAAAATTAAARRSPCRPQALWKCRLHRQSHLPLTTQHHPCPSCFAVNPTTTAQHVTAGYCCCCCCCCCCCRYQCR